MKTTRRIHRAIALPVALLAIAAAGCSGKDSPTAPQTGGGGVPPDGAGAQTWSITVTASPSQLGLPPAGSGGEVPTSTITIQVRNASTGAPPANGTTIQVNATRGVFAENDAAEIITQLFNGNATLEFVPTATGTAVITARLQNSSGQATITIVERQPDVFLLSHIEPSVGDPAGGDIVTIFGQNFKAPVRVSFAGTFAEVLSVSGNSVQVRVPPSTVNVAPGTTRTIDVTVTNAVGSSEETTDTLPNGFTYAHSGGVVQPEVFSVTPTTGPNEGGTLITLRGTGFQAPVQVIFGTPVSNQVEAEVVNVTFNEIRVLSPPVQTFGLGNLNEAVNITVTNLNSGFSRTVQNAFRYGVKVQVFELTPDEGQFTGGELVTIHGSGFDEPVVVTLGGVQQQVISVTGSQIVFRTKGTTTIACGARQQVGGTGGAVTVTNLETNDSGSGGSFAFIGPPNPVITGIFPSEGAEDGGTLVTISGTNFDSPVRVLFGDQTSPSAMVVTSTTVTATTPAFTGDFPEQDCVADGTTGKRFIPASVDVDLTNLDTGCRDTVANAFNYIPDDQTCRITTTAPVASFEFGGASGSMTVSFTDTSTGNPTTWAWDFGDLTFGSAAQHPTHTYLVAGTYTVRLTVTNAGGSSTTTRSVTVPLP